MSDELAFTCPLPAIPRETIQLAHGGGGSIMQGLLKQLILPAFRNPILDQGHDGAVLEPGPGRLAFTTDSYVVRPLEFPGGDIGSLAVNGTVNDLAMCGARARWLSVACILEEGLPMPLLERILHSLARAAAAVDVRIVTGDTKVVDRGHGDGLYLNTAGIGTVEARQPITPAGVQPGDAILVSGDLGRHGIAILSVRDGLQFESPIQSDCAPLLEPVLALLHAGIGIHCLRDLTRGGLAAALHEIAAAGGLGMEIDATAIPVGEAVRGACELLGLDPLGVANEGRFVAFLPESQVEPALAVLRNHEVTRDASRIGCVGTRIAASAPVVLRTALGVSRVLPWLSGEQLPRIC